MKNELPTNPLVTETSPEMTLSQAAAVLGFLSVSILDADSINENDRRGLSLVLQTVEGAVNHEAQRV